MFYISSGLHGDRQGEAEVVEVDELTYREWLRKESSFLSADKQQVYIEDRVNEAKRKGRSKTVDLDRIDRYNASIDRRS